MEAAVDLTARFSHVSDLLTVTPAAQATAPAPLVFRRETSFSSNLLGNSVPQWGSGMAPTKTFGPFVDEHGLQVWFDFFYPCLLYTSMLRRLFFFESRPEEKNYEDRVGHNCGPQ